MTLASSIRENKHLLIISIINFLIVYLSVFNKSYGYFIDEFYYIACANRPALGYVDHPPFATFLLTIFQLFFGHSVYALRILPALASSAAVFMTGIITRETGGGKTAQVIVAVGVMCIPTFAAFAGFYSMNAFEPLLTIIMFYYVLKMIHSDNTKNWIVIGVVIGLGLMNKHTFGIAALFMVISLLVSGYSKYIFNKWFVYGVLISFLIFLPNIIWQIAYHFPTLEFYRNITIDKNVYTPPLQFIENQIMNMSPVSVLLWLSGFFYLLFKKKNNYRFIAVFFFLSFMFFLLSGTSRADRLAFVYPIIFTGGALFWESIIIRFNAKWISPVLIILLFAGLLMTIPIILPYFSYEQAAEYTKQLGLNTEIERGNKPLLPQLLADRIGWKEKVEMVADAYNKLTPEEKKRTIIAGENYGQAGAMELYGKKYNFPIVAAGHNNYYLWSKGKLKGNILIQLTKDSEGLRRVFDSVTEYPGIFHNPYVTPHENNLKVFICRGPKISPEQMLEAGRFYY